MNIPELIFHNAVIRTQDDRMPQADAVAIHGNHIQAVGTDSEILALAGKHTWVVDLGRKLVLPGFIDTHFHFYDLAVNYDNIDLSGIDSFAGMEQAVRNKVAGAEKGEWVTGKNFNETDWPENRMPDRKNLDRLSPDNPVCLWRFDLHLAVANSLALERAGITENTPDPPDGTVDRDGKGRPTGVLRELASNPIKDSLPKRSDKNVMENMQKISRDLHAFGITTVHDFRLMGGLDGADSLRVWQKLQKERQLDIRCHVTLPGEMTSQAAALGLRTGFGDDKLKIGYLKFFADGSMGARTAWMYNKYLDAGYGMPLTPIDEIEQSLAAADAAGLSIAVHAIGTRANHEVIAMFERFEKSKTVHAPIPHRIEHLQMLRPEDLSTLSRFQHVAASCQPHNLSLDISMIDQSVGERGKYAYRLKDIVDSGVPLMLNSDGPVCTPNPLAGIYSAVTRKHMDGTPDQGWYPDQALTVHEAVQGYTLTPASASGVGDCLGSIIPGKLADLVVLSQDIYQIDPDNIKDVKIDATVFDGKPVFGLDS